MNCKSVRQIKQDISHDCVTVFSLTTSCHHKFLTQSDIDSSYTINRNIDFTFNAISIWFSGQWKHHCMYYHITSGVTVIAG